VIIAVMNTHQKPPTAAISRRVVEDVDAIEQVTSDGLWAEYVQLESRRFRVRWTTLRTASMVVQIVAQEIAVVRRVRTPADRYAFIVPLIVPAGARWNGRAVLEGDMMIYPPRREWLAFDPPSTSFGIITVEESAPVVRAARLLLLSHNGGPLTACGCVTSALRQELTCLCETAESGSAAAVPSGSSDVDVSLVACLDRFVAERSVTVPIGNRSQVVGRADEFFRNHVSEGVSVARLSTVAGVSERSLRNAFHEVYTTSPKRYMKLWQLHQVHHALRCGEGGAGTVTEAATCYGFYELGRFAGAYRSLFGEAPSETLRTATHRHLTEGAAYAT
jgi:AraC family ethanolamine operon transcriptional activator